MTLLVCEKSCVNIYDIQILVHKQIDLNKPLKVPTIEC